MTQGSPRRPREAKGGPAQTQTSFPRGPGRPSKGAPRDAQKDPGRPREAQGGPGRPREAQGRPGRPRKAQGKHKRNPGRPRGPKGPVRPSKAQGDTGRHRDAQGNPVVVVVCKILF